MFEREISKDLEKWSKDANRKPLVLRGARQVGKTTVVNQLAKGFKQYIYVNLEVGTDRELFLNHSDDITKLVQSLFLERNLKYRDRAETLLFIDEIQEVPQAFNSLRYFYEMIPELRVIAAGSLLETIFNHKLHFPVGRVEFRVIRPASFREFLGAIGEKMALKELKKVPVQDFAHDRLKKLFHIYCIIGGMPEIVQLYAETKDLTALSSRFELLLASYLEDVEKYARNNSLLQVIRHCIRTSYIEAGRRIKFQNFGKSNYNSKEVGEALRTLEKTFLLSLVYPTTSAVLPLTPDYKRSPKLHLMDTGLVNYFSGVQAELLGTNDLSKVYQGTIIEHLIGQELLSRKFNILSSLNFWVREKHTSVAEVDYVYSFESKLIPIEVKSAKEGALKSLHLFMQEAPHKLAVRVYAGPLSVQTIALDNGKSYYLLNIPYYLTSMIDDYLQWFKDQVPAVR